MEGRETGTEGQRKQPLISKLILKTLGLHIRPHWWVSAGLSPAQDTLLASSLTIGKNTGR